MISFYNLPTSENVLGDMCLNFSKSKKYITEIKSGLFINKIENNKIKHWWDVKDTVLDFYKQVSNKKIEQIVLYRNVHTTKSFNPEKYYIGQEIEQILPFSASIEPEFPVYVWSDRKRCCLLQIFVQEGGNLICLQKLDKKLLLEKMFVEVSKEMYQSEITLGPGLLRVKDIKTLVVPSKEEYRLNSLKEKKYDVDCLTYLENLKSNDEEDFQPFEQVLIVMDYVPYDYETFEEQYFKYFQEEETTDELIEWA